LIKLFNAKGKSLERNFIDKTDPNWFQHFVSRYGSVKDSTGKGSFFGELALFSDQKRSATIVTKTDCELLVVDKIDFQVVKDSYDKKKKIMQAFMVKYFPDIENVNTFSIV
jgi:hypothetical protein